MVLLNVVMLMNIMATNKVGEIVTIKERQSNMELLRIVSMSMIIIHHFLVHVLYVGKSDIGLYRLFDPIFIYGVNLFFLISGYFRINLSVKSLIKIVGLIFIFRVVSTTMFITWGGAVSFSDIVKLILFPISKSDYWFIEVYLGLMVISPFLNKGLEAMWQRQLRSLMILFSVFIVYSCGLGHNDCNAIGYDLCQAIYLYCFAYWLKKGGVFLQRFSKNHFLWAFIVITLVCCMGFYFTGFFSISAYNSIFVISGSACLFLYFTRLTFQNKAVNKIATAALGCYLLQDGIWGGQIYKWLQYFVGAGYHPALQVAVFAACFVAFWILSYFLTIAANWLIKQFIGWMPKRLMEITFAK